MINLSPTQLERPQAQNNLAITFAAPDDDLDPPTSRLDRSVISVPSDEGLAISTEGEDSLGRVERASLRLASPVLLADELKASLDLNHMQELRQESSEHISPVPELPKKRGCVTESAKVRRLSPGPRSSVCSKLMRLIVHNEL